MPEIRLPKETGLESGRSKASRADLVKRIVVPYGVGGLLAEGMRSEIQGLQTQLRKDALPFELLHRMRKDEQIRFGLKVVKAPLYTADFWVEGEDPAENAFLQEVLVERILDGLLRSSLLSYDFGFAAHEIVWTVGDVAAEWTDESGEKRRAEFRNAYLPHSAKEIRPETVTILREPGTWAFAGLAVRQGAGPVSYIDPAKCFVFAAEEEFGGLYGIPRTESCREAWYDKKIARFAMNVYVERSGAPQAKFFVPVGSDEVFGDDEQPLEDPLAEYAKTIPDRLRSSSVIVLPGEFDEIGKQRKWDAEYMKLDARGQEFILTIEHHNTRILRGIFCPDRTATQGEKGAYSQSRTHQKMLYAMANEDLRSFVEAVNAHLIPNVKRLNGLASKAKLVSSGISDDAEEILARIAEKAIESEERVAQAVTQGSIDQALFEDLASSRIDMEKLLSQLSVPVRREKRKLPPIEVRPPAPPPGAGPTKDAGDEEREEKPGGAGLARRIGLASEPPPLDVLDAAYASFLVAEEALLAELKQPYERRVAETEKAARAIAVLGLLRGKREREDGTLVPGTDRFDRLVYDAEGRLLRIPAIAKNHDDLIAAAREILPSADGTYLRQEGNKGLAKSLVREIQGTTRSLLEELRSIRLPAEFLDEARALAGRQWATAAEDLGLPETPLSRAAAAEVVEGGLASRAVSELTAEEKVLREIEDVNEDGWARNVENITIRGNRVLAEMTQNAFFTGGRLAKEKSVLDQFLEWKLHAVYTDLTLDAHFRAVYRAVWLAAARAGGIRYFVQVHPPITTQGEDPRCRGNDGRIGTEAFWRGVALKDFRARDPLEQFGMHFGCRAFWFPVPAETLAESDRRAEK